MGLSFVALVAVALLRDRTARDQHPAGAEPAPHAGPSSDLAPSLPSVMAVMRIEPDDSSVGQLVSAAAVGDPETVRHMLAGGADVDAQNSSGVRALDMAAAACDTAAVDLLLGSGSDPTASSRGGWTPLIYASFFGCAAAATRLIDAGANPGRRPDSTISTTPLEMLAAGWHIAKFSAKDGDLALPLNRDSRLECARILLENGADPNVASGVSPLSSVVHQEDPEIVALLLEHGADPALIPEYPAVLRWPGPVGDLLRRAANGNGHP